MARRRRNRNSDIAGSVGALIGLALLLKFFVGIDLVGGVISTALPILIFAGMAVGAAAIIFLIWVVVNAKPRWEVQRPSTTERTSWTAEGDKAADEKAINVRACLDKLDWFQLEKLVAVLFEQSSYKVESRGGANPDGGIDLVVETEGNRIAIQCKKWATWKCGVAVVRELMGSMVHEGIGQGYLVAREVTNEARDLAEKHAIGIIDREKLITWVGEFVTAGNQAVVSALENPEKSCPKCGARMVLRKAAKGREPGKEFWGCSTFPRCRGIIR